MQHELHLWIYQMSEFLNTSEFIIMINSRKFWIYHNNKFAAPNTNHNPNPNANP
jgi:hypothetical protein